jgi:hypothetical protein
MDAVHRNGAEFEGLSVSTTVRGIANPAQTARLTGLVAMAHAEDVTVSLEFYRKLGFTVLKTFEHEGHMQWACLELNGHAQLMLARSGRPMNPGAQDVLFYLYAVNIVEYREGLKAQGIVVSEMKYPFYSPRGEFRVDDPDGYTLQISHAD